MPKVSAFSNTIRYAADVAHTTSTHTIGHLPGIDLKLPSKDPDIINAFEKDKTQISPESQEKIKDLMDRIEKKYGSESQ